ncbi:HXXEE domain-containing protein [Fictibacillus phosphorivorans]|uniref:HXXEE domain-containing protein n=1 Tax=Fictibacillus phosphorivorans TaxID=1221500 RepID=UPI001293F34D|nr:HXXEE domain-containing protein [Fictibacillus phosphorivorans]MQR94361.1 HXXEE domain-containing protein [Fictibacillus phosphorivorans]
MDVLLILFLFAITLHNLEEAIWLPSWSQQEIKFQKPVGKNEFYFALIIITSFAYLTTFLYLYFPNSSIAKYVIVGLLGSMMFNAIIPHLLLTILHRSYAPGVVTGICLIIPINGLILYRFLQNKEIELDELFLSTLIVGGVLLSLLPILFRLGKYVTNRL